jgi:hypothetical protein
MRLSSSKKIERFFKRLADYTQLRKAAHYVRNVGRPNAVFIWIPKNAGTSMYHALRRYGCVKTKAIIEDLFAEYFGYPLRSDSELLGND